MTELTSTLVDAFYAADSDDDTIDARYSGQTPLQFIAREIGMERVGNRLEFFYRTPLASGPLPTGGILAVVNALRALGGASPTAVRVSPLDLNVKATTYVIFMLDDDWDWKFFPDAEAASMKDEDHSSRYGGLRHVPDVGAPSIAAVDDCHMIYFIADPLPENAGVDPQEDYKHGFSLYVELAQAPDPDTGESRSLKIVIDPDIRNPGGSEG